MALVDRAIANADSVVLHEAALTDRVSGAAITSTGTQIDPMVSGTNFAHLFDGAAGSKLISIPIKSLSEYTEVCLEFYFYAAGASSFVVAKCGADNLIEFSSTGFLVVTLPYSTPLQTYVEISTVDTSQVSINMSQSAWTVFADGVVVAEGEAPSSSFKNLNSISMTSPASGTLVFGAFLMYPTVQAENLVQARQIEAVFCTPDASAQFDFVDYEFSDFSQNWAVRYDIPRSYPWSDYLVSGLTVDRDSLALDLQLVEEYDATINAYQTRRAYSQWGSNMGRAHVRIPSYATSATNRGIIHLTSPVPGFDEFALRFNTGNRLELLRTVWSQDASGVDTSSITTTLMSTPASAITNATEVNVGFGWTPAGLYVVYGSTATLVANTENIPFSQYEAYFGTTRSTPNGVFDQPYFTSQSNWTWEIKLWDNFDPTSPAISSTSYGNHTFMTAEYTKAVPLRGEVSVVIDVPLMADEIVRKPYLYIDGEPTVVTETLV